MGIRLQQSLSRSRVLLLSRSSLTQTPRTVSGIGLSRILSWMTSSASAVEADNAAAAAVGARKGDALQDERSKRRGTQKRRSEF